MSTLEEKIKEEVSLFMKRNLPPDEWREDLNKCLPDDDDVTEHIPLIILEELHKDKRIMVLILAADEVCTEAQCAKYRLLPPDGVSKKWGDLVPTIIKKILFERLEAKLKFEKWSSVPRSWQVQFQTPINRRKYLSAPPVDIASSS